MMVDRIVELASLSDTLNKKSDTLNATISSINDKLAKLNFGMVIWLENFPIGHEGVRYVLGYDKHRELVPQLGSQEKWQLSTRNDANGFSSSLLRAPREIRIQALDYIPALLDVMKEKAEQLIESIEKAEKLAETL